MINITDINKLELLTELYNHAFIAPAAIMFGSAGPKTMSPEQMKRALEENGLSVTEYHDYLFGHCIKTCLAGDSINPFLYDRDCRDFSFQKCVDAVRNRSVWETTL